MLAMAAVLTVFLMHVRVRFVIDLQGGRARVLRGDPPSAFVRGCSDVARLYRLDRGRILGVRTAGGIELRFSRDLPARAHQPLRNVWVPPTGGGPGGGRAVGG
ncbi:hypothetical protein THITH_12395 [Thioalkalivibrio paradoxus ARh 1]|uniref:DUF3634 domain-containing protein n=1 Tax=Thioalkalivibrio paradoxus ARh 1 TaxID=713585 RepID=W0DJZ2_9GAMM|nr:hypothetical protein THITH_12395 [Thioalkalivibrio paradoxus ARh 1]